MSDSWYAQFALEGPWDGTHTGVLLYDTWTGPLAFVNYSYMTEDNMGRPLRLVSLTQVLRHTLAGTWQPAYEIVHASEGTLRHHVQVGWAQYGVEDPVRALSSSHIRLLPGVLAQEDARLRKRYTQPSATQGGSRGTGAA